MNNETTGEQAGAVDEIEQLREQRDALRRALEVIAVGDSPDPVRDAGDELVGLGYWRKEGLAGHRALAAPGAAIAAREQESHHRIPGLGYITDEDDGRVTLEFKDEASATQFMKSYGPSVDCDDMPPRVAAREQLPIDMVLHCPKCHLQHVDAPDERTPGWKNEPHRSHLCHGCGHIWRPADVPTNGVQAVKTTGKADSPIAQAEPAAGEQAGAVALSDAACDAVINAVLVKLDSFSWSETTAATRDAVRAALADHLAAPGAAIAAREPVVTDEMRKLADYYLNAKQPTREEVEAEEVTDAEMRPMIERLHESMHALASRNEAPATPQAVLSEQQLFDIIRGTGHVTRGQAWEIAEMIIAAQAK